MGSIYRKEGNVKIVQTANKFAINKLRRSAYTQYAFG